MRVDTQRDLRVSQCDWIQAVEIERRRSDGELGFVVGKDPVDNVKDHVDREKPDVEDEAHG